MKHNLLISKSEIEVRVAELAAEIGKDFPTDQPLYAVCALKGAVLFYSDIVKALSGFDVRFAFISASSYTADNFSSGTVALDYNSLKDARGLNILIIEDIIDSGRTIAALREHFNRLGAKMIKAVCLLDKPMCRVNSEKADYIGFTLRSDKFVVGYGLDNAQLHRNLSNIYELAE